MPTYVTIESMLDNSSQPCDIYLMAADDVTDGDKKLFDALVAKYDSKINYIEVGDVFDNTYSVRGITKATYFRLLIPWILSDIDKVIYLDGDIIVAGDIAELYNYPSAPGKLIYGVRTPGYSTNGGLRKRITSNGLQPENYINAGILIMNCALLRKEEFKPIFFSHIDKKYFFQDQDILNITCNGRIGYLPLKFNYRQPVQPAIREKYVALGIGTEEDVEQAETNPVIIHYSGEKPWKEFTYRWCDWVSYYRKSPFYDQKLIDTISRKTLNPPFNLKKTIKTLLHRN